MNRLVLCRKRHSHLVTLLSGALILSACAVTTQVPLSQTDNSTTAGLAHRDATALADREGSVFQGAIANAHLSRCCTIQVVASRDVWQRAVGYCALVNKKTAPANMSASVGFLR